MTSPLSEKVRNLVSDSRGVFLCLGFIFKVPFPSTSWRTGKECGLVLHFVEQATVINLGIEHISTASDLLLYKALVIKHMLRILLSRSCNQGRIQSTGN